jgi:hypothetical protein
MEIRYVNSPWIQFQIHPETYQKIKMCASLAGTSSKRFIELALSSALRAVLCELSEGASGDEFADLFKDARVHLSPICP